MRKIIVTGPESCGKTTLCEALSRHFNILYSKEYAREYLNEINRYYNQADLLKIAKKQLQYEQNARLLDTDLITIKIWSKYKYGNCDQWILTQIEKQVRRNRFYLLCKPDIPWKADNQRENAKNREEIFKLYKKELSDLGHNYFIIEGKEREKKAISKISSLMSVF